ncbi:hypothetical protein BS47DRAFT_1357674 [Hydnum rufescens UP504]|uniref:Uncharacterized protein n=1 Tax=Hydnum rufescens UP504 TaxID=1448309 RepID=A0A9P6BCG7_9AGAM|nr:hypothetical protein BS47DRAFT_1357674 [Hydnum rufescens UP504]
MKQWALLSKRWWTTVQRDQRENISKFLVNMWNNACSDTQDHWVKPSYAHLLDQLYARHWCIVDYPNDTRPLSNAATNRTLSSRELKSLLQAFDSDTPPRIVPWAADKVAKDGVDLPLANLGASRWLSHVMVLLSAGFTSVHHGSLYLVKICSHISSAVSSRQQCRLWNSIFRLSTLMALNFEFAPLAINVLAIQILHVPKYMTQQGHPDSKSIVIVRTLKLHTRMGGGLSVIVVIYVRIPGNGSTNAQHVRYRLDLKNNTTREPFDPESATPQQGVRVN